MKRVISILLSMCICATIFIGPSNIVYAQDFSNLSSTEQRISILEDKWGYRGGLLFLTNFQMTFFHCRIL